MEEDRISSLPLELKVDILSRLPENHLVVIKGVSKHWQAEINDPDFIKLYERCHALNYDPYDSLLLIGRSSIYTYDYDANVLEDITRRPPNKFGQVITKIEFVGSCNGLLLFQENARQFSLYNPITGTYMLLPTLPIGLFPTSKSLHLISTDAGFGYDCINNDYKILTLHKIIKIHEFHTSNQLANIYSLKTNSWKRIETTLPLGFGNIITGRGMVEYHTALHWMTVEENHNQTTSIACFNVVNEEYYELPLPNGITCSACDAKLVVLRGCLHVTDYTSWDSMVTIWIMKEYGVKESWTKLVQFSIIGENPWFYWPLPCAYSKHGREVLVGLQAHPENFLFCDVYSGEIRDVELCGLPNDERDGFVIVPWVACTGADPLQRLLPATR